MRKRGWRLYSTFATGSPFGHAQTYTHEAWGYFDIHRFFPGIRLAPDRLSIASGPIATPSRSPASDASASVPAQSLLLILNVAARAVRIPRPRWRMAGGPR